MKFSKASSASFAILALALSACGKSPPHSLAENQMEKVPIKGKLLPIVETFKKVDSLSNCDQSNLPAMLEISAAVDQHQSEIDAYIADQITHPTSQMYKTVQVGPLLVRELIQIQAPAKGWIFETYGWNKIIARYEKVKANPSPQNWSYLNTMVRNILTDERSRIVEGYGYALSYDDEPVIEALLKATQACIQDHECKFPTYSEKGLKWLTKLNFYVRKQADLRAAANEYQRESALQEILDGLISTMKNFQMRKNSSITREGKILHLPLYTSDLASVTDTLSRYIESVWTSAELSLKIDWKPAPTNDLFTVLFLRESNGRSFVTYKSKTVSLYNNVQAKSIAHEIGHVLGFKDHYYDVWDETKCEYQDQYREDDLMSDATYSTVLDEEWKVLQETYP